MHLYCSSLQSRGQWGDIYGGLCLVQKWILTEARCAHSQWVWVRESKITGRMRSAVGIYTLQRTQKMSMGVKPLSKTKLTNLHCRRADCDWLGEANMCSARTVWERGTCLSAVRRFPWGAPETIPVGELRCWQFEHYWSEYGHPPGSGVLIESQITRRIILRCRCLYSSLNTSHLQFWGVDAA